MANFQRPFNCDDVTETPMSRTHQYRKVMKPMLERKRRARINKCLDELKDLMVYALQAEGESISKLEKADVLELTVRHLQKLKRQQMLALNPSLDLDKFHAGYTACAAEVQSCLPTIIPGSEISFGRRLMSHLQMQAHSHHPSRTSKTSPTPTAKSIPVRVPGPLQELPINLSVQANHARISQPPSGHLPKDPSCQDPMDLGYNSGGELSNAGDMSPPSPLHVKEEVDLQAAKALIGSAVWRPF